MNKIDLIDRLKEQRNQLSTLIAELEAADTEILSTTSINELSPEQFAKVCAQAAKVAMKPPVVTTTEAVSRILAHAEFDDEAERLSTGVRRSRAVVNVPDEDKGN
jgi:hypothetical protein